MRQFSRRGGKRSPGASRRIASRLGASFERLEERAMLAVFLVNQTIDAIDQTPHGDGVIDTSLATPGAQISLRAAIQEANALPGPDTIVLPAGYYTLSRAGLGENAAATGDLDITDDLTIVGPSASSTTIDAAGIDRVFHVLAGNTLRLSGITVTGGFAQPPQAGFVENGGGILNSGNVELTDSVLTGNGTSTFGFGGGIYNGGFNSRTTILRSTVSDNAAGSNSGFGGGIRNAGQNGVVTITESTVSGNRAVRGGGIYNDTGTVTILRSTFSDNSGSFIGGGVYNVSGAIHIDRSAFNENTTGITGGGVFSNGGSVAISRSTFDANMGGNAGAVTNQGGSLSVSASTFSANTGAIGAIASTGTAVITGSAFYNNTGNTSALYVAGALGATDNLTATNNTFASNTATGSLGATINVGGRATFLNNTIAGNTAADEPGATGGLRAENGADIRLKNTLVAGNTGPASPDLIGAFTSQGNNLIGNVGAATGFTHAVMSDIVGGGGNPAIDPRLGPLQDNGGLTRTRALAFNSPALDKGNNSGAPATDQRGVLRPQYGDFKARPPEPKIVDIGAYEKLSDIATVVADIYVLGASAVTFTTADSVFANDTNAGGFNAELIEGPTKGSLRLDRDGVFSYAPGQNFDGFDRFTYRGQLGGEQVTADIVTVDVISHAALIVRKLYNQVLNRDPEPGGWQFWTSQITSGVASLGTVASGIFESNERLDPIIAQMYQDYLFRQVDASGLAFWRDNVWKRDGGPDNVISGIISSAEFYASAGGTNSGWVTELYQRLLGRAPDQGGLNHWVGELNAGRLTRPQVVLGFVQSAENFRLLTRGWFQQYLGRAPSQQEEDARVSQLQSGVSQRTVQIQLLDSLEYRNTPPQPAAGVALRV